MADSVFTARDKETAAFSGAAGAHPRRHWQQMEHLFARFARNRAGNVREHIADDSLADEAIEDEEAPDGLSEKRGIE
jgi:hypothetical protein